MLIISLSLAFGGIGVGYFARMQAYKKHWTGDRIAPEGYFTGNLLLFALIETAALFGLVAMYLAGDLGSEVIAVVVCFAFLVLNYPSGTPMLPHGPALARD